MDAPHALPVDEVLKALSVDATRGLSASEVEQRRRLVGRNSLRDRRQTPWPGVLLDQLRSAVVLLLLAAVVAGVVIGELVEAAAVAVVLAVNTGVGFVTELRATRAMEALSSLTTTVAEVERDDRRDEVDASELVPGDVVGMEAGDRVPADVRLLEASDVEVDESALTGESATVRKDIDAVAADTPLAERRGMLHMGTTLAAGRARGVVVATGRATEVGRVAELVETAEAQQAPLQAGLEQLARVLSLVVIGLAATLALLGLLRGLEVHEILEVSIALAVAVVPEGLPAVATLTLTVGMRRMARRNALVRRLPVVETLGSTTVIASDKTGTLTANRMAVVDSAVADGVDPGDLWRAATLCNDADIDPEGDPVGDPTEVALLNAASEHGLDWRTLRERQTRSGEVPFDPAAKRMATIHGDVVQIKGAPEVLLDAERHPELGAAVDDMANRALRTLAVARNRVPDGWDPGGDGDDEALFGGPELLGVVGIEDPPRPEAVEAVRVLNGAGIRVVMVTGDLPRTAVAVARELGIEADDVVTGGDLARGDEEALAGHAATVNVFARVAPEDKLRIVRSLQGADEVVAVTGDGVNDAPALRQADVGVAMGRVGTDVAREAADIVLLDDDIGTLTHAVEEGRRIFANVRRFAQFLFSWHLAVVLVVTAGIAIGVEPPLAGLMILWNNLVIDVIPSFALALEPSGSDAMREHPRRKGEPVIGSGTARRIVVQGVLVGSVGLAAFGLGRSVLDLSFAGQQTLTFVTLTGAQLLGVFTARTDTANGFAGASRNPFLWAALAVTLVLEGLALGVPPLRDLLGLTTITRDAWLVAAALAPVPLVLTVLTRLVRRPPVPRPTPTTPA
ncbi:MAG TPA: cation-transporting P-type ATPase [Acidimicrobiales bacterium]